MACRLHLRRQRVVQLRLRKVPPTKKKAKIAGYGYVACGTFSRLIVMFSFTIEQGTCSYCRNHELDSQVVVRTQRRLWVSVLDAWLRAVVWCLHRSREDVVDSSGGGMEFCHPMGANDQQLAWMRHSFVGNGLLAHMICTTLVEIVLAAILHPATKTFIFANQAYHCNSCDARDVRYFSPYVTW